MPFTLYHNPRCSKSRQTLALLEERNIDLHLVRYLDTPPSTSEITTLIEKLSLSSARELMRTGEAIYKELDLGQRELSEAELIQVMHDHPKLIQRPILETASHAAIGRPPEAVLEII